MPPSRLWWLAILLAATASADDSLCPCVPADSCSPSADSDQEKASAPCEDPGMVRCCEESSSSSSQKHEEPLQMVSTDLEQEQRFMEAISTLMEKMQHAAIAAGENREDKSLDGTSKNALNCEGQECEKSSASKEESLHQPLDNLESNSDTKDLPVPYLEEERSNATEEKPNGEARDKLVIVYAENSNNENVFEEKEPMIVYPSKEAMEEYLQGEETSVMEQMLTNGENIQEDEKQESETVKNQQSRNGKPNLRKLFPKRNPPLKSSFAQTKPEDLGEAGSEIEEVQTTVSGNAQTEQTLNRKPFRSLPRRLSQRPVTTEESSQTSSSFEPARGTRNKIGLTSPTRNDMVKDHQYHVTTATIMDDVNVKAINDMMRTNFTSRLSLARRQRPMWHPQTRLHSTSGTTASSASGRTQHEPKSLLQSTQTSGSTLLDQTQSRISGSSESEQHSTNSTSTEVKGSRFVSRRRNQTRNQTVNQPPKFSLSVSMSQEQVFDTQKEAQPQGVSRRRPSYRRPVKAQSGIGNADLAEQINSQSDPIFGRRRSRFRPRSKTDNTSPAMQNSNSEATNSRTVQNPESHTRTSNPTGVTQTAQQQNQQQSEVQQQGDVKYEDLDGSGSEIQPQRMRVRGRFSPPQRMERGFRPMFGPAELNVVGPVPAGFHDRARGFPSEELGLELPRANVQPFSQFDADQFQFNSEEEMERLLPPVFPVAQPPTSGVSEAPSFRNTFSDDDLLPPLETPKPLSATLGKAPSTSSNTFSDEDLLPPLEMPKPLEATLGQVMANARFPLPQPPTGVGSEASSTFRNTFSDDDLLPPLEKPKSLSVILGRDMAKAVQEMMLDEQKDITELNQEFNQLKSRYDMLLNRYAETLKTYNERFRNVLNSNEARNN